MSGLADLWRIRFVHTRERAAIHTAEDWARRALRLDPGCAGAWYELAWTSADQHLLEQAIEFSLKAVHFSPGTAQFHFGLGNTVTDPGSCRLYLDIMREATRLDPLNTSTTVFVVDGLIRARRPQEALQTADRALAIRTNAPWLHLVRARALVELGRTDEAERVLSQWHGQVARSLPWIREYWEQVHVLCRMEQLPRAQAEAQARILVNRYLTSSPDQYSLVFALEILAPRMVRLGLQKEAMDLMEKKTEIGGPPNLDWLCEDPDLQLLRGDPRFTRILSQAREADRVVLRCFDRAAAAGERPAYLVPAVEALRTLVAQPLPGGA
jgi:tetratricopeptide (TPR) repeat protein